MYVLILIELPAEGGAPFVHPSYNTFNTFSSFYTLRRMMIGPRRARPSCPKIDAFLLRLICSEFFLRNSDTLNVIFR